jgi:hypothetical protein
VSTTVNSHTTSISQQLASINGIEGKYTVKIDNNGYISGFGLISTANNGAPTSTFTVLANNFRIVTPGYNPIIPFQVIGGVTYIKDVVIDSAAIGTATIGTLNIASRAVTDMQPTVLNFNGALGPSVVVNVFTNLTTAYGTAQCTVSGIASGSIVSVRSYFNARRAGSSGEYALLRMRRDDGVILSGTLRVRLNDLDQIYAWEWVDTAPVSTSHTYTVQITRPSGSGVTGSWSDISLIATVAKR